MVLAEAQTQRSMGTENPEIDPHKHTQLSLTKVQQQFNGGRTDSLFNK